MCGKRFKSGNALGGHKTSHRSQPQNKKQRHNHAVNKDDEDDEKHKHSCHVCNKVFSSKQALCGHMRCHKRDGKGIHPPTSSSSIDLSKYLLPISYQTNKGIARGILVSISLMKILLEQSCRFLMITIMVTVRGLMKILVTLMNHRRPR